jgi:hypothetical protein
MKDSSVLGRQTAELAAIEDPRHGKLLDPGGSVRYDQNGASTSFKLTRTKDSVKTGIYGPTHVQMKACRRP